MTLSKKITLATLFIGMITDSNCVRPGSSFNLTSNRHYIADIPRPKSATVTTKPLSTSLNSNSNSTNGNLLYKAPETGISAVPFHELTRGIDILFIRHGKDETNMQGIAHQDSDKLKTSLGYMSRSQSSLEQYLMLAEFGKTIGAGNDVPVFSSVAERAIFTALNLGLSEEELFTLEEFNEQRLGLLQSQKIEDVMASKSFKRMLMDATHKISPKGESGNDVITRICAGLQAIATQIRGARRPKTAIVFTHRLTINWFLRFLLQDMSITIPDFPNCGAILVRYDEKSRKVALFINDDSSKYPFIIPNPRVFSRYLCMARSVHTDEIARRELTALSITHQCRAIFH